MSIRPDIPVRLPKKDAVAIENAHNVSSVMPRSVSAALKEIRRESPTTAALIARLANSQISERVAIEFADMMALIVKVSRAEYRQQLYGEYFNIPPPDQVQDSDPAGFGRGTERVVQSATTNSRGFKAG